MADETTPEKLRVFWVKATNPSVCGCWDRHPAHPSSGPLSPDEVPEVFVSGGAVVQVAGTPVVLDALAKGRIIEVGGPSVQAPRPSEGSPAQPSEGGQAPSDAAKPARR